MIGRDVAGDAKSTQIVVAVAVVDARWQHEQQTSTSVDGRARDVGLGETASDRALQTVEGFTVAVVHCLGTFLCVDRQ